MVGFVYEMFYADFPRAFRVSPSLNEVWNVYFFCRIKTLSASSDHCRRRAMGCRVELGQESPGWTALTVRRSLPVHEATGTAYPANDGRQLPADGSESATYPVNDVRQAWIDESVEEWGWKLERM